jgi:hypothetical protein
MPSSLLIKILMTHASFNKGSTGADGVPFAHGFEAISLDRPKHAVGAFQ